MHYHKKILITFLFITLLYGSTITLARTETTTEDTIQITDVIYRFGPDGTVTPMTLTITMKADEKREDALYTACVEKALNDAELQTYLQNILGNNTNIAFIKSRGRGLHTDRVNLVPVKRIFKKFPNLPPFHRLVKIHKIHANYRIDQNAYSLVKPLLKTNSTDYSGTHSVSVQGFVGYTTWIGMIAERGFFVRCGFAGYGLVTIS